MALHPPAAAAAAGGGEGDEEAEGTAERDGLQYNHFEWIMDNSSVLPMLRKWTHGQAAGQETPLDVGASSSKTFSLAVPGAGSSRLEEFLEFGFSPIIGIDVDREVLQESARRTHGQAGIRWVLWDLGAEGDLREQEEILCSGLALDGPSQPSVGSTGSGCKSPLAHTQALPGEFDAVLDKGTLDFLICEEPSKCAAYLRNMSRLLRPVPEGEQSSGGRRPYVLVSFRARALLLAVLEVFGFSLLEEEAADEEGPGDEGGKAGADRQRAAVYVFAPPGSGLREDSAKQELQLQQVLDQHFKCESRLREPEEEARIAAVEACSLEEAFELLIPAEMRAEYDFGLFREDLAASHPHALHSNKMSGKEMLAFLESNQ